MWKRWWRQWRERRRLLTLTEDGSCISTRGDIYRVTWEPVAGSDRLLQVTLDGSPMIPFTGIRRLRAFCPVTSRALQFAIRDLLLSADRLAERFGAALGPLAPLESARPASLDRAELEHLAAQVVQLLAQQAPAPLGPDEVRAAAASAGRS